MLLRRTCMSSLCFPSNECILPPSELPGPSKYVKLHPHVHEPEPSPDTRNNDGPKYRGSKRKNSGLCWGRHGRKGCWYGTSG
jgi:hypothetical protein